MSFAHVDPQFRSYLREPPRISYTNPDDTWLVRHFVSSIEILLGRNKIEAVYNNLKDEQFNLTTFFSSALKETKITAKYDLEKLQAVPKTGPLMFVANHPFGVVDGIVLCDMALRVRGDLRIMLHSLLCQDSQLAQFFLPIDFQETKQALKTNIRSKQLALEFLSQDIPVLIFPSGMVSTADKFGFGTVRDAPWTTFAAKIIREARATVVPIFFHGQNSRKFHVASHIGEPFRMAMLVHEAINKFGKTVEIEIGEPLTWERLADRGGRQQLTDYLYQQVQSLRN
ncbi:MAG: hemolysin [Gammaproteobacteria bacterium]|jgi:putative hemolysin|nr:hemolysin [Gammaproteobacteria bacterium]|tara:strand:+ start:39 stop:890 length:852 start_codon:yes stop_codon:yes gene_type:complete